MPMKLVLFVVTCLLLIAAISPAPQPYYLAINYATKQCGEYWPGDEYVYHPLPPGWTTYEYQYADDYWYVETPAGACQVSKPAVRNFAQLCCSQLGYKYVSDNVGIPPLTAEDIARQKALQDNTARIERIQTILGYAIVFFSVALAVITIIQWRYEKRKQ